MAATLGVCCGSFAMADPPPDHGRHHEHRRAAGTAPPQLLPFSEVPRSHALVAGTIVGVNYGAASILVNTPHGPVPVAVTPTTSIIRGSAAGSLSDLARGSRVTVDVTDMGGRLIAEIIRIR